MPPQRWFAGLPVVGERALDPKEFARLIQLTSAIRTESLRSYAILLGATVFVVLALMVAVPTSWTGFVVFGITSAVLRQLPQRRFFSPRTLLDLRRDRQSRTVYVCANEDVVLEVLVHSHFVWRRNGLALPTHVQAHTSATAVVPEHAARAARFAHAPEENAAYLLHQRMLTEEDLEELDQSSPYPSFALLVLAIVGMAGGLINLSWWWRDAT